MTSSKVLRLPDGRQIRQVRISIHQPKLRSEPIEAVVSVEDIIAFAEKVRAAAGRVEGAIRAHGVIAIADWNKTYLNPTPNEVECAFCRAMAVCPNAAERVRASVTPLGAIEDLDAVPEGAKAFAERRAKTSKLVPASMDQLNAAMRACGFIEDWVLAIRAEMERRLLAGEEAADFGLELGRRGARAFTDPEQVAHLLRKKYRLKEKDVFNFKLKTPTQLAELTKSTVDPETCAIVPPILGEKRWAQISAFVHQADPKPSVKPKEVIQTPYAVEPPTPLAAIADEDDDSNLY